MRLIRVKWGRLTIEMPEDVFILLVLRAFLLFHNS